MKGDFADQMMNIMATTKNNSFGLIDGDFNLDYKANGLIDSQNTSGFAGNMMTTEYKVCQGCSGYHYSWWPSTWCNHRDKTAEAFKIIQTLMKEGVIKEIKSVNKFITIVGKIAEIL